MWLKSPLQRQHLHPLLSHLLPIPHLTALEFIHLTETNSSARRHKNYINQTNRTLRFECWTGRQPPNLITRSPHLPLLIRSHRNLRTSRNNRMMSFHPCNPLDFHLHVTQFTASIWNKALHRCHIAFTASARPKRQKYTPAQVELIPQEAYLVLVFSSKQKIKQNASVSNTLLSTR